MKRLSWVGSGGGRWAVLAVGLAAVLPFAPVLSRGRFVFDDHVLIEQNADLQRGDIWWRAFQRDYYATSAQHGRSGYYRPVAVLANATDARLYGRRTNGYHLTNVLLHAAASLAAGAALGALGAPAGVAWVAALVFAVHPVHAESVAFVSGRVDLLAGLGIFAALACLAARWRRAGIALGAASLFAFLAKEIAVILPLLVLVAWTARRRDPDRAPPGPTGATIAAAVGAAALVALVLRYAALGAWLPSSASGPRAAGTALLPLSTLEFAVSSLYAPMPRLFLEPEPGRLGLGRAALGLAVGLGLWIGAALLDREARPFLRRCLWAGGIALLPVLNILPQETLLSERFLYVASAFLLVPAAVLASAAWRRLPALRPLTVAASGVALVLLCGISFWRARAWCEDVVLWRIAVQEEPQRAAFWDRLGLALTERRQFAPAEDALRRAVALDPGYFNARVNLGVLLQTSRRPSLAIDAYREALRLDPAHVNTQLNLGLALHEVGDVRGASQAFETAARLKPDNPDALRLAGGTALQLGRLEDARRYLEGASRLAPGHPGIAAALEQLEQMEKRRSGQPAPR